jgi:predicted Fe-S protein YdhL (DUF1289 family)
VIASPCIKLCQMDARHGVCAGCYRTLDEIARWPEMSDTERARLLAELARRRSDLGEIPVTPLA